MAVNEGLIRQTVRTMEEDEERWDQGSWVDVQAVSMSPEPPLCGTTMCFAGFAMLVVLGPEFYSRALERDDRGRWQPTVWATDGDLRDGAVDALRLDEAQATSLFGSGLHDLEEYKALVTEVTGVSLP